MNPRHNAVLGELPESDYQKLLPHLDLVSLVAGQEIYQVGDCIEQVYFPVTALIALAVHMSHGIFIDANFAGKDGIVGMRGLFGKCTHRVYVAEPGFAYQTKIHHLHQLFQDSLVMRSICMYRREKMLNNITIELGCSHFHSNDQRLAKWLLSRVDHTQSLRITATHQSIEDSLGVRRETITNRLAKMKGIRFSRASIEVTDRSALESICCECYYQQREADSEQMSLSFHL